MHQLDLTLAETIRAYDTVIFVDARVCDSPEAWSCGEVDAEAQDRGVTHFVAPTDVMGLCRALYGHAPRGILFAIRGQDFGLGEGLSPETMQAALQVADRIDALVRAGELPDARGAATRAGREFALVSQG
jgi:Ni,Fe-hydrogenase maturation factor